MNYVVEGLVGRLVSQKQRLIDRQHVLEKLKKELLDVEKEIQRTNSVIDQCEKAIKLLENCHKTHADV